MDLFYATRGPKELLQNVSISSRLQATDNILKNYTFAYRAIQGTVSAAGFWGKGYFSGVCCPDPSYEEIYQNEDEKRYYLVALNVVNHCAPAAGYH